ncbi:MAG TPA: hypothetical protein VGQ46_23805 [Thermoanaerobaculia bacterium]|nr:hypothetical protein [Thermoanaerobaculia bacterium]
MAAERYILDDLEQAERDAFEEHFFDCTRCTADVRDAATIADGVRTGTRIVPVKHYTGWAAAAAAAAVVIALSTQYAPQIARLWKHSPAPAGEAARVTALDQAIELYASRGAEATHVIRADQPVSLYFVIPPPETPPPAYTCELRDDAGHVMKVQPVTQKEAVDPVRMPLRAGVLHSGHYTLGIRGGEREIAPYHFTVEVR